MSDQWGHLAELEEVKAELAKPLLSGDKVLMAVMVLEVVLQVAERGSFSCWLFQRWEQLQCHY